MPTAAEVDVSAPRLERAERPAWAQVAAPAVAVEREEVPICCPSPWTAKAGMPPISPDRPTDSATPQLVPTKTLQFELGYTFGRLDDDSGRTDTHDLSTLLTRYGISDKVEGRLTINGWSVRDTALGSERGFSDVNLGAKIALAGECGWRARMALLVDVGLPVGDRGFSNDYVIPKGLFLASYDLTDQLELTCNLGPSLVTRKTGNQTATDVNLHYAVALNAVVSGTVSVFGEAYGALDFGEGYPDRHSVQSGVTLGLRRNLEFDIRGGLGLTDSVPDWLVGAGLSFRLPH